MTAIKHQPATAPESPRPLCDLKMSNVGGFGPKHISLHPFIQQTSVPAALDLAFHVSRRKVHSTTWQKNKTNFYSSLWIRADPLVMVTLE